MSLNRMVALAGKYGLVVALVLAAVWLRALLVPMLGSGAMYLTLFPTVMSIAVLMGLGPGILAGALGALAVEHWLIAPPGIAWEREFFSRAFLLLFSGVFLAVTGQRLREARNQAQEADRRKDEFLAMLAHELRNPLAPIRNAVYLSRTQGHSGCPVNRHREMIERQVNHMSRLIEDLLDVSRITRGVITLAMQNNRLAEIMTHAAENVQPLIAGRRHTLEVTLPERELTVEGDPVRLVQVVGNLLTNAAKYTDPGGRIQLDGFREGNWAVIRVKDNGIGLDPAARESIFGLFTQVEQGLDRSQGGLGIGLTVVKRMVEMHGGRVEAESPGLGQGSVFTVRLPLRRPVLQESASRKFPPEKAGAGRNRGCRPRGPNQ